MQSHVVVASVCIDFADPGGSRCQLSAVEGSYLPSSDNLPCALLEEICASYYLKSKGRIRMVAKIHQLWTIEYVHT